MTNYLYYHLFEGVCFGRRRRVAVLYRKVSNFVSSYKQLAAVLKRGPLSPSPPGYRKTVAALSFLLPLKITVTTLFMGIVYGNYRVEIDIYIY
jgi:hypothetical protein